MASTSTTAAKTARSQEFERGCAVERATRSDTVSIRATG
jgi:hypothetical protein